MRIIIGTNNKGKVRELSVLLPSLNYEILSLSDIGLNIDPVEDRDSLIGNALKKAREIYAATGETVVADDSGLFVDALGGAPGVYSARYAGEKATAAKNNKKLLDELSGKKDRRAKFKTCLVLIQNGEEKVFYGELYGRIAEKEAGKNGFAYDTLFIPDGESKTIAEMTDEEKNKFSHRAIAAQRLSDFLLSEQEPEHLIGISKFGDEEFFFFQAEDGIYVLVKNYLWIDVKNTIEKAFEKCLKSIEDQDRIDKVFGTPAY